MTLLLQTPLSRIHPSLFPVTPQRGVAGTRLGPTPTDLPDPHPGYANEVGESFRPLVPVPVVWASYGVATAYVTADAIDKGRKAATVSATPCQPSQTAPTPH